MEQRVLVVSHSASARDSVLWRYSLEHDERFDLVIPELGPSDESAWADQWIGRGRVIPLRAIRIIKTGQTSLLYRGLSSLISRGEYAFVHVVAEPWSLIAQMALRRLPVAVHGAETIMVEAPLRYRIRRLGGRRVLRESVGVAAWGSESLREFVCSGVSPSTPRAVIPMAIPDPGIFQLAMLRQREWDRTLRLLFVGRLVPEKGLDDLIEAIVSDPTLRVRLRIVGSGQLREKVLAAARADGRLELLDSMGALDIHRQLAWCDMSVVPSRVTNQWTEQWGRVVAEALYAGRPVITSDSGELPRLNPSPDLVYEAGDVAGLHRIISRMAESGDDTFVDLSRKAINRSEELKPPFVYSQLSRFWDEIFDNLRV
jgi:glycosyltransferase involved in cell wall biosynthesis